MMKIAYGNKHHRHCGAKELMYNRMVPMFEKPERMSISLRAFANSFGELLS
jgi:hypothetical protein